LTEKKKIEDIFYSLEGKWRKPPETPMEVVMCSTVCFASTFSKTIELMKSTEGKSIVLNGRKEQWSSYKIAEELHLLDLRNKNGKS